MRYTLDSHVRQHIKRYGFLWLLLNCAALQAQFYTISGTVSNSAMEPVAFAQISVLDNPSLNAKTDLKGHYAIKIAEGSYVLVFSMKGYKSLKIPVTVSYADVVQNCILEQEETDIKGVKVSVKKEDRSEEIIRRVIEGKYRYLYQEAFSADAYIKATETETQRKPRSDTAGRSRLNMAEVYLTVHFSPPDKIREERNGVDIRGDKSGLFYLTHTDGQFNFYRNLLEVPALSESPILSPLSNSGLIAYKYKMLKIFVKDGIRYYRIRVSPGLMGNALVSGELVIQDSVWCIRSLKLSMPRYHMAEYDFFEIEQDYSWSDTQYLLTKMEFRYEAKAGRSAKSGRTVVYYSNYLLKQKFSKKFFGNEISSTAREAYERDSSFWGTIRKEPFNAAELAFIRQSDSIKALQSQKSWQDSTDKDYNRITPKKVLLTGQGFYKRSTERFIGFKPLILLYTPVYIAGPRLSYWVTYERTFKNKKEIGFTPTVNYGLLNKDLKGSLNYYKLYNPFSRGSYNINVGSDFGVINPYSSWIMGFRRQNFYVHDYASAFHRIEVLNGFYIGTGVEYANRRSIADMKFDQRGDSLLGNNTQTTPFEGYQAFYGVLNLYYVPFQKYIREPYQKLILGSKWPEISARYRKGMPVMGSIIDFDYLEFVAEQELKIGLAGISKYRFVSGEFLSKKDLRLVDYRFQRATGPLFFANPLYAFQGIDTSFITLKRFYEGHYFHRFNGALINKIPILKKLNISECAGGGILLTRERNLKYIEMFVGVEKILRIMKERVRIGLFYVVNVNNSFYTPPQFKFTIEVYDKIRNKWPY